MSHVSNLESSNQKVIRAQTVLVLKKEALLPVQTINCCVNKWDVNADILLQISVPKCVTERISLHFMNFRCALMDKLNFVVHCLVQSQFTLIKSWMYLEESEKAQWIFTFPCSLKGILFSLDHWYKRLLTNSWKDTSKCDQEQSHQ